MPRSISSSKLKTTCAYESWIESSKITKRPESNWFWFVRVMFSQSYECGQNVSVHGKYSMMKNDGWCISQLSLFWKEPFCVSRIHLESVLCDSSCSARPARHYECSSGFRA